MPMEHHININSSIQLLFSFINQLNYARFNSIIDLINQTNESKNTFQFRRNIVALLNLD
jgi:hypothetical protein